MTARLFGARWCSLVAAVVLAGCSGPKVPLEIGMNEAAVDIIYGDHNRPPDVPQPRPPGALASTAPGFIGAPESIAPSTPATERPGSNAVRTSTTVVVKCADPPGQGAVTDPAPSAVTRPPAAGSYGFRRQGQIKTADNDAALDKATARELSSEVARAVGNVTTEPSAGDRLAFRFDVVETASGIRTTTSFLVDSGRADTPGSGGLFITRILTERPDLPAAPPNGPGVESFNPQPPIRIMDLPAATTQNQSSGGLLPRSQSVGTDPLTGASMTIVYGTEFRRPVNACGTVVDAWQVRIYPESSYSRQGVRSYSIAGTFKMAPQLGGLVVEDSFTLRGTDVGGKAFEQKSSATINSVRPAKT